MAILRVALCWCPVVTALAIGAFAQTPPSVETQPDKVVLRAGESQLTAAQFNAIADSLPEQFKAFAKGAGRKQFAEQLAKILVLAEEGRRRKLDQASAFQIQSRYRSDELLSGITEASMRQGIRIDDATVRDYYEAHKSDYERVRARHILIRMHGSAVPLKPGSKDRTGDEALARAAALRKRIVAGEDFAKIAASDSDDTGSAPNGGELGWFSRGQMVDSFENAAFQLSSGQVSEPVESPFGFHIIQVEGHEARSLDDVKGEIEEKVRSQKIKESLDELFKGAGVDYDAGFFGLNGQK
jgi:peptidyl-prolyl cis-trans isomerase C